MRPKQFDIWLANLNPNKGAEPGKTRPVTIIQTDLLNDVHPTVVVCPITSSVTKDTSLLRVHLRTNQLEKNSDILVDQIRAIDKSRLIKKLGILSSMQSKQLKNNIQILLDLE